MSENKWASLERLAKAAVEVVGQPDEDDWFMPQHFANLEPEDAAFIAAADPAAVLELIVAARRTPAPEGEAVTVWYGKMPESNGRENWTASLRRVNSTDPWGQEFCFARSEYPDRVRYEADRVRWIIGELPERPDILAYDADKHSGYVPPASPVVPVGNGEPG